MNVSSPRDLWNLYAEVERRFELPFSTPSFDDLPAKSKEIWRLFCVAVANQELNISEEYTSSVHLGAALERCERLTAQLSKENSGEDRQTSADGRAQYLVELAELRRENEKLRGQLKEAERKLKAAKPSLRVPSPTSQEGAYKPLHFHTFLEYDDIMRRRSNADACGFSCESEQEAAEIARIVSDDLA